MTRQPDFLKLLPSNDEANKLAPYTGFVHFKTRVGSQDFVTVNRTDEQKAIASRAREIADLADSDRLDPFTVTAHDMMQYARPGDDLIIFDLAVHYYRLDQYEEFRVGYCEGMEAMRHEHQY